MTTIGVLLGFDLYSSSPDKPPPASADANTKNKKVPSNPPPTQNGDAWTMHNNKKAKTDDKTADKTDETEVHKLHHIL